MKPKLLLVSDTYYPQVDGTVRFIEEFLKRTDDSFETTLLVPQFGARKEKRAIFLSTSALLKPLPTYPSIKLSRDNFHLIKKAVREHDLIFVQGPALASLIALYYARKFRKKSCTYLHVLSWELFEKSSSLPGKKWMALLIKKIFLWFYNSCDEVLVPYHELKEQLQRAGLTTALTVARLGVDIDKFHPGNKSESRDRLGLPKEKKIVCYVGRISKEKNIPVLLEAFKRLHSPEKVLLVLVGAGPPQQTEQCELRKNCLVTGFVSQVEDYLQAADIFVMPSLMETTSLATLEAMSCGLPVIVTKVGYVQNYVVKNHSGLFFPKNDPSLLAAKIERLLNDKELREKLGVNARKTMAYSFSWERSINKIKRILLEKHQV